MQTNRVASEANEARTATPDAPTTSTPALKPGAQESFHILMKTLRGTVDIAVAAVGASSEPEVFGSDDPAHGWSTTKVPVLAALIRAEPGGLSSDQKSLAESAITESNNESILSLFHDLEVKDNGLVGASDAVEALLRESGDNTTLVATAPPPPGAVTTFGQTEWSPSESVRFFSALARGCLLSQHYTDYVLGLMQHIEPSESWGLGSAGLPRLAFKGGWGPEGAKYLVRQSGIVDAGTPSAVAVSLVAYPPSGSESFAAGTAMLGASARWLKQELTLSVHAISPCAQ